MEIASLYFIGATFMTFMDVFFGVLGEGQEVTSATEEMETTTKRSLPEFCSKDPDYSLIEHWRTPKNNALQMNELISVNYELWVGNCALHKLELRVPLNSTFLDIMLEAISYDQNFHFCGDVYSFGLYIKSVSGLEEQKEGKWHWLYYRLKNESEFSSEHMPKIGVHGFVPEHGDNLIFSFNKLAAESH